MGARVVRDAGTECRTPECQSWTSGRGFPLGGFEKHPYCELCQVERGERDAPKSHLHAAVREALAEQLEQCLRCGGGWLMGVECRACCGTGQRVQQPAELARPLHPYALERVEARVRRELIRQRRQDAESEAGAIARSLTIETPDALPRLVEARGYRGEDAYQVAMAVWGAVDEQARVMLAQPSVRFSVRKARPWRALRRWADRAREAIR
ncbi:MAG: hypothetical protein RLP09_09720 [Sandaracinaceae bacterium]